MKTAKDIIKGLPLNMNDIARLTLEATEELGESAQGLTRLDMLHLLRRVIRAGVKAVKAEEHGELQVQMQHFLKKMRS